MHLKEQLIKKRASQIFFETKSKIRASQITIHQKRASQIFLDPIQNVHCQGPCSLRPCISRPYCILSNTTLIQNAVKLCTCGCKYTGV